MTTFTASKPDGYVTIPVSDANDGMIAALHIVLNHTADIFIGVVDAIADHYGLDKEEMIAVIRDHPKYTEIQRGPVLSDLGYMYKEKAIPVESAPVKERKKREPMSEEAKAAMRAKRAATIAAKAAKPEPEPQPRKFQFKKKVVV